VRLWLTRDCKPPTPNRQEATHPQAAYLSYWHPRGIRHRIEQIAIQAAHTACTTSSEPEARATHRHIGNGEQMTSRPQLDNPAAAVLTYLYRLARAGEGYERRGVRGWALIEDVRRETGLSLLDVFHGLRRRGLVDADDVTAFRGARSVCVYRITSTGTQLLASAEGVRTITPLPPGGRGAADAAVYVSPNPLKALQQLRIAYSDPTDCRHLPGERGWRTEEELLRQVTAQFEAWLETLSGDEWSVSTKSAGDCPLFDRSALPWLRSGGWAQSWGATPGSRRRPIILWRITPAGLAGRHLRWNNSGLVRPDSTESG
jgi:hypothetical protein